MMFRHRLSNADLTFTSLNVKFSTLDSNSKAPSVFVLFRGRLIKRSPPAHVKHVLHGSGLPPTVSMCFMAVETLAELENCAKIESP